MIHIEKSYDEASSKVTAWCGSTGILLNNGYINPPDFDFVSGPKGHTNPAVDCETCLNLLRLSKEETH